MLAVPPSCHAADACAPSRGDPHPPEPLIHANCLPFLHRRLRGAADHAQARSSGALRPLRPRMGTIADRAAGPTGGTVGGTARRHRTDERPDFTSDGLVAHGPPKHRRSPRLGGKRRRPDAVGVGRLCRADTDHAGLAAEHSGLCSTGIGRQSLTARPPLHPLGHRVRTDHALRQAARRMQQAADPGAGTSGQSARLPVGSVDARRGGALHRVGGIAGYPIRQRRSRVAAPAQWRVGGLEKYNGTGA